MMRVSFIILLLNLGTLLTSLACTNCSPHPKTPKYPPRLPPKHPPHVPKPTHRKPPHYVLTPPMVSNPPHIVLPPIVITPSPTLPPPSLCPPPPPQYKAPNTCPIDTLKLGECVDVLGGLIHIGIGKSAKDTCCPVLEGLLDLDAALCLCTTIKANLLNINLLVPISLQVLASCGKTPPPGFQCPA